MKKNNLEKYYHENENVFFRGKVNTMKKTNRGMNIENGNPCLFNISNLAKLS